MRTEVRLVTLKLLLAWLAGPVPGTVLNQSLVAWTALIWAKNVKHVAVQWLGGCYLSLSPRRYPIR